jgi:hypothetical protein
VRGGQGNRKRLTHVGPTVPWTTSGLSHIAEVFAFHFMRAFLVESPQMAPQKAGLFLKFGNMGKLPMVKR